MSLVDDIDVLGDFFSRRRRKWQNFLCWGDEYLSDSSSDNYDSDFSFNRNDSSSRVFTGDRSVSPVEVEPREMQSLVDLAAQATAKHYSCSQIELQNPPLDEVLLEKVAFWAFPQEESRVRTVARLSLRSEDEWKRGDNLVKDGLVRDIQQVGFMVTALIYKQVTSESTKEDSKVYVTFEKQHITSTNCAMCPGIVWCPHILAVIIHRIRYTDEVPVHAPVTEVLSTLTRDQLQKLLQYAINEDAGGILGRVFQHINAIRDPRSSHSNLQGAPDPTFGVCLDDKTTWELTLEQLQRNLQDDFDYGIRNYPDTCNINDKMRSGFSKQYLQRVHEMIQNGEEKSATRVLITIAKTALKVLKSGRPKSSVKRLFLDLERLWSLCILSFDGPVKEELVSSALEINRETEKIKTDGTFYVANKWSDISSIHLTTSTMLPLMEMGDSGEKNSGQKGALGAFKMAPFYQPVCVSLLPDPSPDLYEILSTKSLDQIDYKEPVPLMLLRFESFLTWPRLHSPSKILKIGLVIIRHLLNLSDKFSIIGSPNKHVKEVKELKEDIEQSPIVGQKRKRRNCSSAVKIPSKKKKSERENETADILEEGLSIGQISCALLYVTCMIMKNRGHHTLTVAEELVLTRGSLRAIELGRLRFTNLQSIMTYKDFDWLLQMEEDISARLLVQVVSNAEQSRECVPYIKAMQAKGLSFYEEKLPLTLFCILMECRGVPDGSKLELCVEAFCHSTYPLSSLIVDESSYSYSEGCNMKNHILKKWNQLIGIIFNLSCLDGDTNQPAMITKVLKHLNLINDGEFVAHAFVVIRDQKSKLTLDEHCVLFLEFILGCIKKSINTYGWSSFKTYTQSCHDAFMVLGKEIKLQFPHLILPFWSELCKFFSSGHLKSLLRVVKSTLDDEGVLPSELAQMLLAYFDASFWHDEECIEMLNILDNRKKYRKEALKKILQNFQHYTCAALLQIAKTEHEFRGPSKSKGELFQKDVFQFLQKGLQNMKTGCESYILRYETIGNQSVKTYLQWFYTTLAQKSSLALAKGEQFSTFLEVLSNSVKGIATDSLISLLETLKQSGSGSDLFREARHKLGSVLVDSYAEHFDSQLKVSNHCAYHKLLGEMMNARKNFLLYINNGDDCFKTMISNIRKNNRGKKKLLKLLNEYFNSADTGLSTP